MTAFSAYGAVDVVVDDGLSQMLATSSRELVAIPGRESVACVAVECDPTIGHVVDQRFGVTGALSDGRFLYPDGRGHYCEVELGSLRPVVDASTTVRVCCPAFSANVLLEWIVLPLAYFPLADRGWAPLHASGIADEGGATVFAAWSGVGKTNLILARMASRSDETYLGDDIVLVHADGMTAPSSRTVSAYGYNRRLLDDLHPRVALRMRVGEAIRRAALGPGRVLGRLQSPLLVLSSGLANHRVEVRRARGMGDFVPRPVTAHVRCVSAVASDGPMLTEIARPTPAVAAAAHLGVLDYEFVQFRRMIETWRWATGSSADPWFDLRARWRESLEAFFAVDRRYFELALPQSGDPEQTFTEAWTELDRARAS